MSSIVSVIVSSIASSSAFDKLNNIHLKYISKQVPQIAEETFSAQVNYKLFYHFETRMKLMIRSLYSIYEAFAHILASYRVLSAI